MKKVFFIGLAILVASGIWLCFISNREMQSVLAQTDENEAARKRDEHDKNIPQKKVDRAHLEARKIKEDIVQMIAKHRPKYQLTYSALPHEVNPSSGQKGVTRTELGWKRSSNDLYMVLSLDYDKADVKQKFDRDIQTLQIGDLFALPNIGDEAILVKNVTANKTVTEVGMHFLKGRAQVDIYFTNGFRTTAKNEKELMEFVNLIEPLVVARENFFVP